MKQLNRYVAKHVIAAILLVIAMLVGLFSVSFCRRNVRTPDHYSLTNILIYVPVQRTRCRGKKFHVCHADRQFARAGILANQSELTVMRARHFCVADCVDGGKPALVMVLLIGALH